MPHRHGADCTGFQRISASTLERGKPRRIAHHASVVKETVIDLGCSAELPELGQFGIGILVVRAGPAVQPEILHFTDQCRWRLERIHDMYQVEFPAKRGNLFRFPSAARFPTKLKLATLGFFEKSFHAGNVLARRRKTSRALENHKCRIKLTRHGKSFVPRPADRGVEAEVATMLPVMIVERRVPVSRAGGPVSDNLPSFHRELKPRRRGGAPAGGGWQFGEPVEAGVNLDT